MYKTRFVFRDGCETVFAFENYGEARDLLIQDCILCGGELLYAYVSCQGSRSRCTTDLIDCRFRADRRVISPGDLLMMPSEKDRRSLTCCFVDRIDARNGRLYVTVFDRSNDRGWYGIERFL